MGIVIEFPGQAGAFKRNMEALVRRLAREDANNTREREDHLVNCAMRSIDQLPPFSLQISLSDDGWPATVSSRDRNAVMGAIREQVREQITSQITAFYQEAWGVIFRLNQEVP